jgi:endoglucanase
MITSHKIKKWILPIITIALLITIIIGITMTLFALVLTSPSPLEGWMAKPDGVDNSPAKAEGARGTGIQLHKPTYTPPSNKYFGVNVAGAEFDNTPFYTDTKYQGYKYFHDGGLTLIRLPVKWERIETDIDKYTDMILAAQTAGDLIIIDLHNYGKYKDTPLTAKDSDNFSDIWSKIANKYSKGYPGLFGYELMNEPHDLEGECDTWKTLAQSAIYSIRKTDNTHYILIPGYDWQSANRWQNSSNCLADIKDPANKILFSAHQYFDSDYSGSKYDSTTCTDEQRGTKLIQPFLNWLEKNNATGIFTEYGVPANSTCWLNTLDDFLNTLKTNNHLIGGTYWAAGPAWGDYNLSVEPDNGIDKPQMTILKKYPSTIQN